jgi:hypothetical protein
MQDVHAIRTRLHLDAGAAQAHRPQRGARRHGCHIIHLGQEEMFFFEKKNQKTFAPALGSTGSYLASPCAAPNR